MPKKYPPLSLIEFERILRTFDIVRESTEVGHKKITIDLGARKRVIVYQTTENPIPLKVLKNAIDNLGVSADEFYSRCKSAAKKKNVKYFKRLGET